MKSFVIAISTALVLTACATHSVNSLPSQQDFSSDVSQQQAQQLNSLIEEKVAELKLQGLSVSIGSADELLFSSAYGWASKEDERVMTPSTPSMVGSVSKLFTVTAIMKLADEGRLDLNAPITRYIPEYSQVRKLNPDFSTPQVRHLLNHHSGIQSDLFAGFSAGQDPEPDWAQAYTQLPEFFAEDVFQVTEPDTVMSYSNLSFSLLALIIERASGQTFEDYLQQSVFMPLGMASASFTQQETTMPVAAGHKGRKQVPYMYIRDLAAGSMIASTDDLVKYGQMILRQGQSDDAAVLSARSVQAMLTQQNVSSPLDGDFKIGYGFWLDTSAKLPASVRVAGHGGDLPPYHAAFLVLPEYDLTVAILANSVSSSMALSALADELAYEVLDMQQRLPSDQPREVAVENPAEPEESVYSMPFGYVALTEKTQDQYKVETSLVNFRALRNDDNSWQIQYRLFGLFPIGAEMLEQASVRFGSVNDETVAWLYINNVNLGVMTPVQAGDASALWQARAGTYKTDDETAMFPALKVYWDKEHQLLFAGPKMALGMGMFIPAKPWSDDILQLQGYGRNLGEVMQWVDEDTIRYSGLIYKR